MESGKKTFEDLVEFYNQWPDLRETVQQLLKQDALKPNEKSIVRSMMHVVDCVGPEDLKVR